jgi:DNA repair protein RecO (recombination protein O)
MPLHESEAIVLQSYPLGEADRLVSFLSRTLGRVRGVAAGARKPKSRFGSTLERLSYVRIWFFERENRELVRISQCEMIESFISAFSDYPSSVALAIFSEVTEAVLPDREASDASFRLLLLVSRAVKRSLQPELPLAYFVVWIVKLGGWLPSFSSCARCGRDIQTAGRIYFSKGGSAVVCESCRRPGMRSISKSVIIGIKRIVGERLEKLQEANRGGDIELKVAREISNVMLDVIEAQIGRKLKSRELLESPE